MPASPETWRLFVGVPIPAALRSTLAPAVGAWRADPSVPNLRWTDPDGWHLTLAFLGPIPPDRVPQLIDALAGVAMSTPRFTLPTGGVGVFPRPAAARTVWYGVTDADDRLAGLAARVSAATDVEDDGRFHAHLTLARSRRPRGEPLTAWLSTLRAPAGSFPFETVNLYRSHLGRGATRHEILASFPLGGARSARD